MIRGFDYERLKVFDVAVEVYASCSGMVRRLPWQHRHLARQLLRASSSIVLNLAEGCSEFSRPEKRRFFRMSLRSAGECGATIALLTRVGAVDANAASRTRADLLKVMAMVTGLIKRTERDRDSDSDRDGGAAEDREREE